MQRKNRKMWGRRGKGNKYGATKVEGTPGHWFDSKAEKALFHLLSLRERGGEIRNLSHHPGTVFLSEARVQYRPDFRFIETATGETAYAEFKGYSTQAWAIKKRLWAKYGPGKLYIYGGSVSSIKLLETLNPCGSNARLPSEGA